MKLLNLFLLFQLSAEGLWVIELKLEPGTYEYKYLNVSSIIAHITTMSLTIIANRTLS